MRLYGFRFYPAAWSGALATALAAVVAFGFLPKSTADYVSAAGVALLGLVTMVLARPVVVPAIAAAMSTFLVSLGGFGLHLTDAQLAGVMGVATMILTWAVHKNVVPAAGSPSVADPRLHPLVHAPERIGAYQAQVPPG